MKDLTKYYKIKWEDWCNAIDKQPIDNELKFEEIIENTINYIKNN